MGTSFTQLHFFSIMCNPKRLCARHIQPRRLGTIAVCGTKDSPLNSKCKGVCATCSLSRIDSTTLYAEMFPA
ncbi:Os07g0514550 [Oryza sativa Japonica Group]|uniref:Os07g0514550 protein n=1 Tax=Oryza sativa subsp. japonica TaxID=39947 RepID=A0A0P0X6Z6_ORYSJ|nr:hypothetical protein EE612_039553 [Oryza sativa]BAT01745.1 Os07g0514550 [Oryza sativa Japonica Group]